MVEKTGSIPAGLVNLETEKTLNDCKPQGIPRKRGITRLVLLLISWEPLTRRFSLLEKHLSSLQIFEEREEEKESGFQIQISSLSISLSSDWVLRSTS